MKTTLEVISEAVTSHFNLNPEELFKKSRKREVVYPRQIFQYLSDKYTYKTLEKIGSFGFYYTQHSFDHATVLHSRTVIRNLLELPHNKKEIKDISEIRDKIEKHLDYENILIPQYFNLLEMAKINTN